MNEAGAISGRAKAAVRGLSPTDFNRIVEAGLAEQSALLPRIGPAETPVEEERFRDERAPFVFDEAPEMVATLVSRVVRKRVFRQVVLRAYDERCAVTGLKLINGGDRAEVEAAHIRPVEANGPDIVSNGLALSGTAHWMFDRGLIGFDDDMRIIVSRQVNDPDSIHPIVNRTGRALLPHRAADRRHPQFVGWHQQSNANSHLILVGLAAHVLSWCAAMGARPKDVHMATWRRHILGSMPGDQKRRAQGDCDGSGPRARLSSDVHDQVEAIGILDYALDANGILPPWHQALVLTA
jgi:hypothetical protein